MVEITGHLRQERFITNRELLYALQSSQREGKIQAYKKSRKHYIKGTAHGVVLSLSALLFAKGHWLGGSAWLMAYILMFRSVVVQLYRNKKAIRNLSVEDKPDA